MINLYAALRLGLWGPFLQIKSNHNLLLKQHELREVVRSALSGKKFKPQQFPEFYQLYPMIDEAWTLGSGSKMRKLKHENGLAEKALAAFGDSVPDWFLKPNDS